MNRTLTIFNILKGIDLKGGRVYNYSRAPNSLGLDVVITDESIDIHAKNIIDGTQPDLPNLKYALDKVQSLLSFLDDGILTLNKDGNWFIRISLENIGDIFTDAELHENKSLDDGYGGSIVFNDSVWNGAVALQETRSNLLKQGSEYNLMRECVLLVPKDLMVKKNNFFLINGIKYVVNGIVENKVYVGRKN